MWSAWRCWREAALACGDVIGLREHESRERAARLTLGSLCSPGRSSTVLETPEECVHGSGRRRTGRGAAGRQCARIHQRIADGSLSAERIGSQWVVDERSLRHVQERSKAGRPRSARSAWAVIAASVDDRDRVGVRGPASSARSRMQLKRLLEPAAEPVADEEVVGQLVVSLRSVFRNRVQRRVLRAAPADLVDLRADDRWTMLVDLGVSGIASPDVQGYLGESDVDPVVGRVAGQLSHNDCAPAGLVCLAQARLDECFDCS